MTCIVAGSVWLFPKNPPAAAVSDLMVNGLQSRYKPDSRD